MSAIGEVLWPGIRAIVGDDAILAGITVNKGGYHSTRNWLKANRPDDYSIQLPDDQLGPSDEGSAIDITFRTAQAGDYRNIAKYSRRLYEAGVGHDDRAYPLREFYGNTDLDEGVEGWSYYRDAARSSDPSHVWHIHMSIYRRYINDEAAMRSILKIWEGDDVALSDDDIRRIAEGLANHRGFREKLANEAAARVWQQDTIPNWINKDENPNLIADGAISIIGNQSRLALHEARESFVEILDKLDELLAKANDNDPGSIPEVPNV